LEKMNDKTYECEECGKRIKNSTNEKLECCGKPMKQLPLDICTQPSDAEHARLMENDEPCDDGRAG
jgi:hypothetical protein